MALPKHPSISEIASNVLADHHSECGVAVDWTKESGAKFPEEAVRRHFHSRPQRPRQGGKPL
jgi:hypothetical protein